MGRHLIRSVVVVAALGLFAGAASAQRGPQPPRDEHLFFAQLWLGLGDCGGHWCGPAEGDTGPSFGTGAGVFIRPIPYLALGVEGHFNWMAADHEDRNREAELGTYGLLHFMVRGIIPVSRVDIWGGAGFGFGWWGYYWDRDGEARSDRVSGVTFPFAFGADVHIVDRFWLGGMFRFAVPVWNDRCDERPDRETCRPFSELDPEDQDEYPTLLWFTGITGRIDF